MDKKKIFIICTVPIAMMFYLSIFSLLAGPAKAIEIENETTEINNSNTESESKAYVAPVVTNTIPSHFIKKKRLKMVKTVPPPAQTIVGENASEMTLDSDEVRNQGNIITK